MADFVSGVLQKQVAGLNFGVIDSGLNVTGINGAADQLSTW